LVVALLGALGYIYWQNYMQPKTSDSATVASKEVDSITDSTVINEAYTLISNKYASDTTQVSKNLAADFAPAYKPDGIGYYVTLATGVSLTVNTNTTDYENIDTINANLK
jgi:hypothetical protein